MNGTLHNGSGFPAGRMSTHTVAQKIVARGGAGAVSDEMSTRLRRAQSLIAEVRRSLEGVTLAGEITVDGEFRVVVVE